jgi:hypothetical protein
MLIILYLIVMLNVIMLSVIMLSVIMLSVIMVSVIRLSVIMLSVVRPSVAATAKYLPTFQVNSLPSIVNNGYWRKHPRDNLTKLFAAVTYKFHDKLEHFQPSLLFMGKARSLP